MLAGLVVQEESKVITGLLVIQEMQEIMAHVETVATEVTVAAAVPMVDLLAVQDQVEPEVVIQELVATLAKVQEVEQVVLEVEDKLVTQEQLVETAQPELLELLELEQTQDKMAWQEGTAPTVQQERLARQELVRSQE